MTKSLKLSPNLKLPLEAATRRLAILAMSGAGKSNVAVVMAEQMFEAGIPWVAIDPKGDWWGVRSSKDGKGPGLPVPIFGGLHGDIPLEPSAGKLIGDTIVDQRLTCVLDISEFPDRQQQWGFLIDLGETLLRRNREALHLFLEEADEYLPQRTSEKGNLPKCLGVWQRVVKRGRFRGIGSTQITQRNASLNKDTLYQAEALIAMRVGGKADREAVRGWVDFHNASEEIIDSLPTLGDGEGWFSSPAWMRMTKRVQFDRRQTFDSGATPVHLKGKTPVATLADVNLDSLKTRMAETIEKAKADDPKELRKRIAELEKALKAAPAAAPTKGYSGAEVERMVARETGKILRDCNAQLARIRADDAKAIKDLKRLVDRLGGAAQNLVSLADDIDHVVEMKLSAEPQAAAPEEIAAIAKRPIAVQAPPTLDRTRTVPVPARMVVSDGLSGVQQKIIDAIARLNDLGVDRPDKIVVAALAGYGNLTSKGFANAVGALRSAGHIIYPGEGKVSLTDSGAPLANHDDPIRSIEDLHGRVFTIVGGAAEKILRPILEAYPSAIDTADVAAAAGYTNLTSKGFANAKGRLRTLGLIDYPASGKIVATELLFPKGL